ncbi:hypothetical protein MKW98_028447 [Papaver atlanticum]|uniref:Uncharacterized protein n=1 Tax=Papaver atlanticum TaxID=357466 RepID=A0AAD4TGC2_9MAGN|nr:hypothetical protein MKW98_028447 [Papaver atlanticum]
MITSIFVLWIISRQPVKTTLSNLVKAEGAFELFLMLVFDEQLPEIVSLVLLREHWMEDLTFLSDKRFAGFQKGFHTTGTSSYLQGNASSYPCRSYYKKNGEDSSQGPQVVTVKISKLYKEIKDGYATADGRISLRTREVQKAALIIFLLLKEIWETYTNELLCRHTPLLRTQVRPLDHEVGTSTGPK